MLICFALYWSAPGTSWSCIRWSLALGVRWETPIRRLPLFGQSQLFSHLHWFTRW